MRRQEEKKNKEAVTFWIDKITLMTLDKKAMEIDRSRSWMANMLFRQALGMLPEKEGKK